MVLAYINSILQNTV